jgi:hypothetical protein
MDINTSKKDVYTSGWMNIHYFSSLGYPLKEMLKGRECNDKGNQKTVQQGEIGESYNKPMDMDDNECDEPIDRWINKRKEGIGVVTRGFRRKMRISQEKFRDE